MNLHTLFLINEKREHETMFRLFDMYKSSTFYTYVIRNNQSINEHSS